MVFARCDAGAGGLDVAFGGVDMVATWFAGGVDVVAARPWWLLRGLDVVVGGCDVALWWLRRGRDVVFCWS